VSAIITAEHLSKWYGQVIGLNDVSVSVPPGITGLLGPNGAGKSTFMKLITGQLKPSKGEVKVLGEPIWRNPKLYFRIGFCPEQDRFYERMTGMEWVTALVRLNGYGEQDAKAAAERALTAVDLMEAAHKKIGAYSKGMRQRVKLAQSLVHDPEHGSARTPPHDQDDPRVGAAGEEHPRLEPHPPRDRVDDVEHPADQQRQDSRGRQRPPDPGAHRRASPYGAHPRGRSAPPRA
jgi:ABC-type ATPase involved in cell division